MWTNEKKQVQAKKETNDELAWLTKRWHQRVKNRVCDFQRKSNQVQNKHKVHKTSKDEYIAVFES